jgi:hypothetical protein
VIHKQILETLYTIRVGENPIATRAGNIAAMTVKFRCPEKILCPSSPVILEKKISLQR